MKILGITPAYAGKSRAGIRYEVEHRDHPRLCGEKVIYPKLPKMH